MQEGKDLEELGSDQAEEHRTDAVERVRRQAAKIEPGMPGYCDLCGAHFERVVVRYFGSMEERIYACGGCRDKYKLG